MIMVNEKKLNMMWTVAKYTYGLVLLAIGIDKFTFCIVNWNAFVSPFVESIIPHMYLIPLLGTIEIGTALAILTHWPRLGAYAAAGMLGLVIINLFLLGGVYDIILRDVAIAFGYIMFGLLTELKETAKRS